jgi:hypothetical protein
MQEHDMKKKGSDQSPEKDHRGHKEGSISLRKDGRYQIAITL